MARKIKKGETDRFFFTDEAREEIARLSIDEIESLLQGFTKAPIIRRDSSDMQLSRLYHILCWIEVLKKLSIGEDATVVEIGLGGSVPVRSAFVNLARQWISEADIGFETVSLDGFDPKWWGFFRKY